MCYLLLYSIKGSKRSKKSKEVKSTTEGDRVTSSKGEESPKTKEQSKKVCTF